MLPKNPSKILLIGSDTTLGYLLKRYTERSGYQLVVSSKMLSLGEITTMNPAAIIFLSLDLLETAQTILKQLASLDSPIMVCGSIADEVRIRELGADYCLPHPLTYDGFQAVLIRASIPAERRFTTGKPI